MDKALEKLLLRFREQEGAIRHLAATDSDFRALCEEHALAAAALSRFEALQDASANHRIAEYRILVIDLEQDIETMLAAART